MEYIEIAPNYAMAADLTRTFNSALGSSSVFTYKAVSKANEVPPMPPSDGIRRQLNYLLYPQNIQAQMAKAETPEELIRNAIAEIPARQQIGHFYSKDTLGQINLVKQIQNKDIKHALATVMDYETITLRDAYGNEKNWIYNAAFQHVHSDATIGNFKKDPFQHFFIGIYDPDQEKYLKEIADKVRNGGIGTLTQDESVAFEYLSRLGASITDAKDLLPADAASKIFLTDAPKESFMLLDNYNKAFRGLKELGDLQKAQANNKYGITAGVERIIDNLAEIVVNDNAMITGWNADYDVSRSLEMLETIRGAEEMFRDKIAALGKDPNNYTFSQLRQNVFDPVNDLILPASGRARSQWHSQTFGSFARQIDPGMHNVKFEHIAQAQALLHPEKAIYAKQHHNAGVDVLQEFAYIFDQDSSLNVLMDDVVTQTDGLPMDFTADFGIKGMLFQAKDSGSMKSLRKYNKNVFATVQASNGNLYSSNGWLFDKKANDVFQSTEFTPGAWSEGVTYEILGGNVFSQGSDMYNTVSQGRPELMGEDIVQLQMRVGLLNKSQRLSEAGQEIHTLYIPKSKFVKQMGTHFRNIGRIDDDGKVVLNQFGREQAQYIQKKVDGVRVDYGDNWWKVYQDMNEMKLLDRAERSYTKRTLSTNERAIMLRDILDTGTFQYGVKTQKAAELRQAVLEASKGNISALDTILAPTGQKASDLIKQFWIEQDPGKPPKPNLGFNNAWFSNTLTIAETMEKGSLFEQMHRAAIEIIDDPKYLSTVTKNKYFNRNEMYRHIMAAGTEAIMHRIPEKKLKQLPGWVGRPMDNSRSYWINAQEFLRPYQDEHEIVSATEQARRKWIQIDFQNPYTTVHQIAQKTGMQGRNLENDKAVRKNLLAFADYLSREGRIDDAAREELNTFLNEELSGASNYGISAKLGSIFEGLKSRQRRYGWAEDEVFIEHSSFLTQLKISEDDVFSGSLKDIKNTVMRNAADEEVLTLADYETRRAEIEKRLIHFMDRSDAADYAKQVTVYDDGMQKALNAVLRENQYAINKYAGSLVNMLNDTGLGLTVDENIGSVFVTQGSKKFDITHLIPQLQTNAAGIQSWVMGDKRTRYNAMTGLKLGKDLSSLQLTSMMDFAQQNMFRNRGGRAGFMLREAVRNGEDPRSLLEWILKRPTQILREDSQTKGAIGSDIRSMVYAKLDPILEDKTTVGNIVRMWGNASNINDTQKEAVGVLKKYYEGWGKTHPIVGLEQQKALLMLIQGDQPIFKNATGLAFAATAKQTGSESLLQAIAQVDTIRDYNDDPGKMLANQLDNSLYFRTQLTQQEEAILKAGNIDTPSFGPLFGTKTEHALSSVETGGIRVSNQLLTDIVDANDKVKGDIYDMLVQKYNNDKTIANVFGARYMPYEGGGLLSSRLWDVLDTSNTWKKVRWNRQKLYGVLGNEEGISAKGINLQDFYNKAALKFGDNGEFLGYGQGIRLKKGDAAWTFYSQYMDRFDAQKASQDAIVNVMYLTKEGGQVVDADTLRKNVEESLRSKNKTTWTSQEFIREADQIYDRYIVAKNVFDNGVIKLGFDSEKHESVNAVRTIGQLYNGTGTDTWMQEEKLLRDIFFSDEFDKVAGRMSQDFRGARSLNADLYYDIANLNFSSALFNSPEEAEQLRGMIQRKAGAYLSTIGSNEDVGKFFYRIMDESRHRLSDALKATTGGTVFGKSFDLAAKHGNVDMLIHSTAEWLRRQMEQNRGAIQSTQEQAKKDLQNAYKMILETGAITDKSGQKLRFGIHPVTGGIMVETGDFEVNAKNFRELFRYDGSGFNASVSDKDLDFRFKNVLSDYFDVRPDGTIGSRKAILSALIDPVDSDKLFKVTDRELISYSNTLWDDGVIERVKKAMGNDQSFRSIFGQYIDQEGRLKNEFIGKSVWTDELNSFFDNVAFMRYGEGRGLIRSASEIYDTSQALVDPTDYREEKTRQLVERLGKGRQVSKEYADDLYEVASLKRAAEFNRGGMRPDQLVSDNGQIRNKDLGTKQFFKEAKLSDIDTSATVPNKKLAGDLNIYRQNLLIDVTDSSLGLTRSVLGLDKIALAGIDLTKSDDIASATFQSKVATLQKLQNNMRTMDQGSEEYAKAIGHYKNLVQEIVTEQSDYANGNKIKTSKTARLYEAKAPASLNHKVQVQSLEDKTLGSFMEGRTFNGEDLAALHKKGRTPNFAVISQADLADMGYTDEYFKKLGVNKEEWLKKARTEGISGTAHRWPSDYWGSQMAVQIYVDDNVAAKGVRYDSITAAFLKADSDGDWGQLMLRGASVKLKDGKNIAYTDSLTASLSNAISEEGQQAVAMTERSHLVKMHTQMYDTNAMVARNQKYRDLVNNTYETYYNKMMDAKMSPIEAFGDKLSRIDLAGNLPATNPIFASEAKQIEFNKAFDQHRERIAAAIEQVTDYKGKDKLLEKFRGAKSAGIAAGHLQAAISKDVDLRRQIYQNLGDNADAINLAFKNAASTEEARKIALQRIARKGVGLSDTPFTSMDFLRMNALALDQPVLTNSQNTALSMVKELTKEELLTTKKMDLEKVYDITKNLDTLNTMISDIVHNGKNNEQLKRQWIDFIAGSDGKSGVARAASDRYEAASLLSDFVNQKEGTIDMRKVAAEAYEGLVNSSEAMRENTSLFRLFQDNMTDTARGFKGRLNMIRLPSKTFTAQVNNAFLDNNGYEDTIQKLQQAARDIEINDGLRKELAERGAKLRGNLPGKVIKNFKPSRSLAISALTLAGAAVFGGYAGGNPAQPAQQQAQNIQEQNPPPRNINLADPSLTVSNRKQAGYVININAQTQKDKEYASRLITQAVTRNFQDTNVNVSMNVNQQPGNISGNDLMDYLTQAIY